MAETRARDLAKSLGQAVKTNNIASDGSLAIIGVTAYDSAGLLPVSYDSNNAGSLGFAKDSDRLYVHTGQGWFNIAIVNTTPIFTTSPAGSYELASDATAYKNGTATTITIQARDSEGFPVTYAATGNTAFNNIAHVDKDSAAGFIFTVEPKSQDSVGEVAPAAGTLTFTATDGINIASAASTFNLVFDTSVANSEGTVMLMRGVGDSTTKNANFDDVSDTNNTITSSGDPYMGTFTPYNSAGYCTYFDGTDDFLTVPASSDFALGTGSFTIELWVYFTNTSLEGGSNRRIFSLDDGGNAANNLQILVDDGSYRVNGDIFLYSNSIQGYLDTNIRYGWHHIAIVRNSGTLKLYLDGLEKYSASNTQDYSPGSGSPRPVIGSRFDKGDYNGYISDFRIVVGTAVYTANFTPPSEPLTAVSGTKLLLGAKSMMRDSSSDNRTITINGNPEMIPFSPYKHHIYDASKYGGSVFMDGSDSLTIASSSDFDFGTGDFTMEVWGYHTSFSNTPYLFDMRDSGSNVGTTNRIVLYMNNSGNINLFINGDRISHSVYTHTWNHYAVVKNSGTTTLYVNGVSAGTYSDSVNYGGAPITIGMRQGSSTQGWNGFLSDIRIVKEAAVYTGAFTPPTGPLTKTGGTYSSSTNVSNPTASQTRLLMNFTNGDIIDHSGTHNLKPLGNTQSDTGNQKYGVPSVLFDGTGDGIDVVSNGEPLWFPKDFTIECWAYVVSGNFNYQNLKYRTFFFVGVSSQFQLAIDQNGNPLLWDNNSAIVTSSTAVTGNTWHHIAVTRTGDQVVLFLDGVEKARATHTTEMGGYDTTARIGSYDGSSGALNGAISDLRITKDLSRYPFIPLKETLTTTTTFQGTAVGNSGSDTKLIAFSTATLTADASGQSNALTISGVTASTFSPSSTMRSALFDGSNDTASVTDSDFGLGSNFTFEVWIYPTAAGGDSIGDMIFMTWDGSNSGAWLSMDNSRHLNAKIKYSGGWILEVNGTYAVELNRWHHVAMVRNSGTVYVFLNGCKYLSGSNNSDITGHTQLFIGHQSNNRHFNGYMSNVRVINGTAIYDTDFTPPSVALTG